MESEAGDETVKIESVNVYNYTLVARSEWLFLLAANFPVTLLTPLLLLASPHPILFFIALFYSFLQFLGISITLIVLAVLIDFVRVITSVKSKPIPPRIEQQISDSLKNKLPEKLETLLKCAEVVTADLSMGAQVRGVVTPTLVLSGGMLVALIRKDPRAIGILLHEYAHIQNFDSLLPAIIGLSIVDFLVQPFIMFQYGGISMVTIFTTLIYKLVVFVATVFLVSRGREYYADAGAIQQLEEKETYRAMLADAFEGKSDLKWSFFHPSLSRRIKECRNGHKILFAGLFWKLYWLLLIITSWLTLRLEQVAIEGEMYYSGVIVVAGLGLVFELFRKKLLGLRSDSMLLAFLHWVTPGKRFFRLAFLIIGFITVSILSYRFGGENAAVLQTIGGATVYGLWLFLK